MPIKAPKKQRGKIAALPGPAAIASLTKTGLAKAIKVLRTRMKNPKITPGKQGQLAAKMDDLVKAKKKLGRK